MRREAQEDDVRDSTNLDNARHVTAYLGRRGPLTMATLKDDLAARCGGSKERVEYGIARACRLGWISRSGNAWGITDKGWMSLVEAA